MSETAEFGDYILKCLSPQGLRGMKLMTGAGYFVAGERELSFRFKGNRTMNHVKIALNGADTFDVTFGQVRADDYKTVQETKDVHVEELANTFRDITGLETRIPTITEAKTALR